jgi:hypothetical protein
MREVPEAGHEVISTPDDIVDKCQQIEFLHYRLMVVYVYAIERTRAKGRLPAGVDLSGRERRRSSITQLLAVRSSPDVVSSSGVNRRSRSSRPLRHGAITRALVESHIKGKLGQLQTAYAQIEQSLPRNSSTLGFQGWLRDSQDSLTRFSATFSFVNFVRRTIATLWPLLIAVAVVGSVWNAIFSALDKEKSKPGALGTLGVVALIVFIYAVTGLSVAANRKRKFFLARISIPSAWADSDWPAALRTVTANNVYEVENELFGAIGRSKNGEFPLDICMYAIAFLGWAAFEAIVGFNTLHSLSGRLFFIGATIFFACFAVISVVTGIKRKLK